MVGQQRARHQHWRGCWLQGKAAKTGQKERGQGTLSELRGSTGPGFAGMDGQGKQRLGVVETEIVSTAEERRGNLLICLEIKAKRSHGKGSRTR